MSESEAPQTAGWGHSDPNNWVNITLAETHRVAHRLDEFLGDRVDVFFQSLGMVFTGTRRMGSELPDTLLHDRVTLIHASRVYTNCLGTYMMLRQGMILETYSLLKSSVEAVAQAALFLRDPHAAAEWHGGRRFTPDEVRRALGGGPELAGLYKALYLVAHANPEAAKHHTVDVPERGLMTWYGGCYRPKEVTTLLAVLVDVVLVFLAEFHRKYAEQLDIGAWPLIIAVYADVNDQTRQWEASLPDDIDDLMALGRDARPLPPVGIPPGVTAEEYERFKQQLKTLAAEELRAKAKLNALS